MDTSRDVGSHPVGRTTETTQESKGVFSSIKEKFGLGSQESSESYAQKTVKEHMEAHTDVRGPQTPTAVRRGVEPAWLLEARAPGLEQLVAHIPCLLTRPPSRRLPPLPCPAPCFLP